MILVVNGRTDRPTDIVRYRAAVAAKKRSYTGLWEEPSIGSFLYQALDTNPSSLGATQDGAKVKLKWYPLRVSPYKVSPYTLSPLHTVPLRETKCTL